jgi:predicted TIM-barrel enzyme
MSAGATVQSAMKSYLTEVSGCAKQSSPVVCLEAADRQLGNKVHVYANVLATDHGFTAPRADQTTTLNEAQLLANSLEILGDAQPTQANYNQVLNTFNVNSAITRLQGDVTRLAGALGK